MKEGFRSGTHHATSQLPDPWSPSCWCLTSRGSPISDWVRMIGEDQRRTPVPMSQEHPYLVSWLKGVRWFSALGCLCQKGKTDGPLSESAFMGGSCVS